LEIFRPRWLRHGPRPVVVVFHGGGWELGSRAEMRERVCRRYLAHGFLVVNVDYRVGLKEASEDADRVLAWCFEASPRYGGDTSRIVVTGESAGAHLALLAAFRSPRHIAAVVNFYGVTDLSRMADLAAVRSAAAGEPPGEVFRRFSPINYAGGFVPVISIHGTDDRNVPIEQTELLTQKMRAAGVVAEQVVIDHARHGFSERQSSTAYRAVFDFLRRQQVIP
jgi:acetyl esterase/lipase